jgi:dihydrolipoamide dehydrogenase
MKKHVDVAVIGAGHAGLNAIKEIRKVTDNWVLINGGPLGTTCARIGCMPSKVAIHLADTYKMRDKLKRYGVSGGEALALDRPAALEHVRDLRDTFVDLVLANTTDEMDAEHLIQDYAELLDAHRLRVGEREISADAIVVATGARSVVPDAWRAEFGDGILTVDEIFEQESCRPRWPSSALGRSAWRSARRCIASVSPSPVSTTASASRASKTRP